MKYHPRHRCPICERLCDPKPVTPDHRHGKCSVCGGGFAYPYRVGRKRLYCDKPECQRVARHGRRERRAP